MESLTVLVTGVGGGGHGEQIFKALRLGTINYHVIGTDMSPNSLGLLDVDQAYILPHAGDSRYVESLLKICQKHKVLAVFHGSEPELKVMSTARKEIEARGIFLPINPPEVIDLCMDKARTCDALALKGFHVPTYRRVTCIEELKKFDMLPAVLKPSTGGGGSANVYIAQTHEELINFGKYMLTLYPEFIAQEYIGTPESEFTVGVLLGLDGELLNSIAVRRNILTSLSNRLKVVNRTSNAKLGHVLAISNGTSQGEIGRFPEVTEVCEQIALAIGCRGVLNVQCRLVEGKVYVFEINPRFSGTTSLRAMVGYNEPDILIRRHVLNEYIPKHFPYRSGVIARGLTERLMDRNPYPCGTDL